MSAFRSRGSRLFVTVLVVLLPACTPIKMAAHRAPEPPPAPAMVGSQPVRSGGWAAEPSDGPAIVLILLAVLLIAAGEAISGVARGGGAPAAH